MEVYVFQFWLTMPLIYFNSILEGCGRVTHSILLAQLYDVDTVMIAFIFILPVVDISGKFFL